MTDEEIDQIVKATDPVQGNAWIRPFRKFGRWFGTTRMGEWMKLPNPRWQTIVGILVAVGTGFPLVANSIGATNKHVTEVALKQVQQQIYISSVISWSQAIGAHDICVTGVSLSDANRAQWRQLTDVIAALDSGSGRAIAFANELRNGPLLSTAPREVDDCPNPGPAPLPPTFTP